MNHRSMIASNTSVRDFAYPESHALHRGGEMKEYDEYSDGLEDDQEYYDEDNGDEFSSDEINRKAIALFDFVPENDNEVALREGQLIWISYRHGQGWLVAEDPETGENGLVPEEYVEIWDEDEEADEEAEGGADHGHAEGVEGAGNGYSAAHATPQGVEHDAAADDVPKRFLPEILHYEEGEWVDTDDEDDDAIGKARAANSTAAGK